MVASGLAMGVFVGLVVVRGTGEAQGQTVAATGAAPGAEAKPSPSAAPAQQDLATPKPPPAAVPATTPPAAPQPPPTGDEAKKPAVALLTFDGAPRGATILVDGQKIEGTAKEVALDDTGKAQVKIQVKASGYRPYADTIDVTGDKKISVDLDRVRRPSSSGKGGGKKGGGDKDKEGPAGPGGLIKL